MPAGDQNQSAKDPLVQQQGQPVRQAGGQSQGLTTVTSTSISSGVGNLGSS